jgi:hypothetical protein
VSFARVSKQQLRAFKRIDIAATTTAEAPMPPVWFSSEQHCQKDSHRLLLLIALLDASPPVRLSVVQG